LDKNFVTDRTCSAMTIGLAFGIYTPCPR